jgi:hypothetical protein
MNVAAPFPWLSQRQHVLVKHDVIRCPIENATEDIARRLVALEKLVQRDAAGIKTDVKALTHLLKGRQYLYLSRRQNDVTWLLTIF